MSDIYALLRNEELFFWRPCGFLFFTSLVLSNFAPEWKWKRCRIAMQCTSEKMAAARAGREAVSFASFSRPVACVASEKKEKLINHQIALQLPVFPHWFLYCVCWRYCGVVSSPAGSWSQKLSEDGVRASTTVASQPRSRSRLVNLLLRS